MALTSQTQSDLTSILETLDQRIHELTSDGTQQRRSDQQSEEVQALQTLRGGAVGMLRGNASGATGVN